MSDLDYSQEDWNLFYDHWDPEKEPLRESLTTLGNGYFATRGCAEESVAGDIHYPGTYLAGGYNRAVSQVNGQTIENEDLVNWPNWLPIRFRIPSEDWFSLDQVEILSYQVRLDMANGTLHRLIHFKLDDTKEFKLKSSRVVHMSQPHIGAIQWELTPLNYSGPIEVRSLIDGNVKNSGVDRYQDLESQHTEVLKTYHSKNMIYLSSRTKQSKIEVAIGARTTLTSGCYQDSTTFQVEKDKVSQSFQLTCQAHKPITLEKVVAFYSSKDKALSEPLYQAKTALERQPDFETILFFHKRAWRKIWDRADIKIRATTQNHAQQALRLHIFHLFQTASQHTIDLDVGFPARGLHGEAYRGHIFWDELFAFPIFNLRLPELTRSLLMYRYRRLPEALHGAKKAGFAGAMFPWQSGSDGREESQVIHLNPKSNRWIPDHTHRQRHINSAIAYNVWQYFQTTQDMNFVSFYGAELLASIAKFWASIAQYNPKIRRYEIKGVVGPDEYHTQYPGTESQGLNNNAYTNVTASWVLKIARQALDRLASHHRDELCEALEISVEDLSLWQEISHKMYVPFIKNGIIEQFEGWSALEELDWEELKKKHGDIQRLDRVLEAENLDPNQFKACKQADVLMLFYLFNSAELATIFQDLSYEWHPKYIQNNIEYYQNYNSHGSTLSRIVYSWVMSRSHRKTSWSLFKQALSSDIDDIQGGTTSEGIHTGAMGGTIDLIQRCYGGIKVSDDILWLNPKLPAELEELDLNFRFRSHWLKLFVSHEMAFLDLERGWPHPIQVGFKGQVYSLAQGQRATLDLQSKTITISHNGKNHSN